MAQLHRHMRLLPIFLYWFRRKGFGYVSLIATFYCLSYEDDKQNQKTIYPNGSCERYVAEIPTDKR
jgi:hypothetical protein